MGERLAVDHRVGVVEDDRAALLGQLAGDQPVLERLELGLEGVELGVGVAAAQHGEALLLELRQHGVHRQQSPVRGCCRRVTGV